MKKCNFFALLTFLLLTFSLFLNAAFEEKLIGAKPQGLAGSYVARSGDVYSIFYNPAGLRLAQNSEISFSQTKLYNIKELNLQSFAFMVPTLKLGTFGIGYNSFGFSDYKENSVYLSESFHFGKGIYLGFNFKNMSLKMAEFGSASLTGIDIGLLGNISEKFSFGFSFSNINNPHIGNSTESPQKTFKLGACYTPGEEMSFSFDLWNLGDSKGEFRLGSNIYVFQYLALRFGLKTNPNVFSFGFGLFLKNFELSYAYLTHPYLDPQQQFSLSYMFSMKKEETGEEVEEPVESSSYVEEVPEEVPPEETKQYDLNSVTYKELISLGINKKMARRIIAYRISKGSFNSVMELKKIKGMKNKLFKKLRKLFYVSESIESGFTEEERPPEEIKKELWNEGLRLFKEKKYKEAKKKFEEILEIDPKHKPSKLRIKMCEEKLK